MHGDLKAGLGRELGEMPCDGIYDDFLIATSLVFNAMIV